MATCWPPAACLLLSLASAALLLAAHRGWPAGAWPLRAAERSRRLRAGTTLLSKDILVDTEFFDKSIQQVVHRDQYSPGYALEMPFDGAWLSFEVVPSKGGLIQAFGLNGTTVLLNRPMPDQMDGSVFWPSPQSAWGWPPPAAIDPVPSKDFNEMYTAAVDVAQASVTLTSPVAATLGVRMRKSFSADPQRGAVVLNYEILNVGEEARSFAPWEVTRVPAGGLSFFDAGNERPSSGPFPPLPVETVAGATWFQQNPAQHGGGKLYASPAQGWLAHISGELLFVKCFDVVPARDAAPDEKQIELYNGGDYVELEVQGPYSSIPPGGVLQWRVLWYLRHLAPGRWSRASLVSLAAELCSAGPRPAGDRA